MHFALNLWKHLWPLGSTLLRLLPPVCDTYLISILIIFLHFSDFAECLFSKGVTWPLIISFFAFSGALAVECARNGRSILVKSVTDWATIFTVMRLKEWIIENGKWVRLLLPVIFQEFGLFDLCSRYTHHTELIFTFCIISVYSCFNFLKTIEKTWN